jgi:hypothetical protein
VFIWEQPETDNHLRDLVGEVKPKAYVIRMRGVVKSVDDGSSSRVNHPEGMSGNSPAIYRREDSQN